MKYRLITLAACLLVLPFSHALAKGPGSRDSSDVLIRVNAPVTIPAGDSVGTAIVIRDSVTVDGIVKHGLVVINGTAIISGVVLGDVAVIRGHLVLNDGARVNGDVKLFRSTISRAPGAVVGGGVETRERFFPGRVVPLFFWLGTLIAAIIFGILLMTFASRQITDAADMLVVQTGKSALGGLIVWFGLPAVAIASFFTLIGIPVGIVIFLIVLPALWIGGYVVAALTTGVMLLKKRKNVSGAPHPYLTVALGIVVLHVIWAIPFLGGVITFILVWLSAGALALRAWQHKWKGTGAGVVAGVVGS